MWTRLILFAFLTIIPVASDGSEDSVNPKQEEREPMSASIPFIDAMKKLETVKEKMTHLRSWNSEIGKEDGLSETNVSHFGSILELLIFHHTNEADVIHCKNLEEDLRYSLPDRHELEAIS